MNPSVRSTELDSRFGRCDRVSCTNKKHPRIGGGGGPTEFEAMLSVDSLLLKAKQVRTVLSVQSPLTLNDAVDDG
ncbi:hypothetical protein D3C78_1874380 [compost metagenome]